MTITENVPFSATALISYCWGENIKFSGTIKNYVLVKTTPEGIQFSRHWSVTGLTGKGVTASGILTGTNYIVKKGTEMFFVKNAVLNADGTLNVSASLIKSSLLIHRGDILFENTLTGATILARHRIIKLPGCGIIQNGWFCGADEHDADVQEGDDDDE